MKSTERLYCPEVRIDQSSIQLNLVHFGGHIALEKFLV